MYAQSILYDTLVSITADGYEGCLAESWDISEDGCTYTFHIRPNVLFSDGESVMPMPFLPTSTPFWKTANATLGWK